jgi:hypothetical protein
MRLEKASPIVAGAILQISRIVRLHRTNSPLFKIELRGGVTDRAVGRPIHRGIIGSLSQLIVQT